MRAIATSSIQAMSALPLSEADLDRLEELLDSDIFGDERLLLDEVQALLCAVSSGPSPLTREDWLPVVLGDEPAWVSPEQEAETIGLLTRFHDQIADTLAMGEDVAPVLYPLEEDSEELDLAAWADAYLLGTELSEPGWFEVADEHGEALFDLLYPVLLLSGALEADARDHGERWLAPAEEARAIALAQDDLVQLPKRIHAFWKIKRQPVETIRREAPKVGRNDPCPCGSGKKYKQCCGSA